mmetsp:Transcript_28435/g.80242  ORF Transcript_28435/g.80242 Transcript_28435/m.80242 type:complete len:154 (-) Transcript_28435:57-518(-)|eukprot:CAMPEP_0117662226 /NCGR_PEP_ID=MMETSP0804-20121206/7943_1 /TAXON_ID=1074897 /ORGANISM="Tetraselmis astigmatica, Strain CCMP880" /LENGTH=153 /DNA_ID=CAMNT_0005469117 /DNA_START=306 /DNA_END=767 /DNA_ORIENTATION=+
MAEIRRGWWDWLESREMTCPGWPPPSACSVVAAAATPAAATAAAAGGLTSDPPYGLQSLGNLLWLPVGVFLFLVQIILGITMFISIIGIPFGLQHFKLSILCLWPMGTEVTAKEETSMFVQPPPQVVAMQAPVYAGTAAPPQTNPPPPPPVMV